MIALLKESRTSRWADFAVCSTLVFLYFAPSKNSGAAEGIAPTIAIHSSLENPSSQADWFSVTGLPRQLTEYLEDEELSTAEWKRIFLVTVNQEDLTLAIEQPAMAGHYTVEESSIKFTPRFPLTPGNVYRATFISKSLSKEEQLAQKTVSRAFEAPKLANTKGTIVNEIYPSANVLPENLLKFYVHFSAPMSGNQVHRYIQLINEKTGPVELPFLELDDALWNLDMTQLTLFIDPGRIKREVKPLEDVGPALLADHSYRLVIDKNWLDANGNNLSGSFVKPFDVDAADRSSPEIERWELVLPMSGTRDALIVKFGEPMDNALAQRMIRVETKGRSEIVGSINLTKSESEWNFVPREPWRAGEHVLAVQTTIEDLAGNNIGKLFEVDLRRETGLRPLPKFARRRFGIQ